MRKQGKSAFGRELREYALGVGVELHQSSKNIAGPHVVNADPPSVAAISHCDLHSQRFTVNLSYALMPRARSGSLCLDEENMPHSRRSFLRRMVAAAAA